MQSNKVGLRYTQPCLNPFNTLYYKGLYISQIRIIMIVPDAFIISILEPLPSRAITFKKLFKFYY